MQLEAKQAQYAWIEQKINYFICFVPLAVFLAQEQEVQLRQILANRLLA